MAKKILILTANFGQGHLTASRAVKEAIEILRPDDVEVSIVDFVTTFESLLTKTMSEAYKQLVRFTPKLYRLFYRQADRKLVMKLLNLLSQPFLQRHLKQIFTDTNPDLVISTFPLWNYFIQKNRIALGKKIPFATVITDTLYRHVGTGGWTFSQFDDVYFVPNKDSAMALFKQDIPKNKVKVFGFPLRKNTIAGPGKEALKQELGFHPGKKVFLMIMNTGVNVRTTESLLEKIDALPQEFELLVITGKNEAFRKRLEEKSWQRHTKILGWMDPIQPYLDIADVVFTKAGGASTMECIEAKKPMIITHSIPGQEEANVMLIQRHHLGGVLAHRAANLEKVVEDILKNYDRIVKNLAALSTPDASADIAKYVLSLLLDKNKKP